MRSWASFALQAQDQATQRRDLSTLAPLRALRARTPESAWARRVVGEGVRSCPRAGCGRSACPVPCAASFGQSLSAAHACPAVAEAPFASLRRIAFKIGTRRIVQ